MREFLTPPQSPREVVDDRVAETSPRRLVRKTKKLSVQFSPYNRVQLISPRRAGDELHIRQLYASIQEGHYENEDEEEEEWEKSISSNSTPDEVVDVVDTLVKHGVN